MLSVATVPLSDNDQAVFGATAIVIFLFANRREGRGMTLALVVLSCAVSLRYIVWRVSDTLEFNGVLQAVLGVGLALAELLRRRRDGAGLHPDRLAARAQAGAAAGDPVENWPTVDVYIPTYNELLSVVRATVLAALAIDYPRDKFRVYILDDGRRSAFRDFAEALRRRLHHPRRQQPRQGRQSESRDAPDRRRVHRDLRLRPRADARLPADDAGLAGARRRAWRWCRRRIISIRPIRSSETLPPERRVPSEGNMFYALVQDGNDFWDAAFFCGSCAVIRRAAL